ncbi:OB-fold domain-containing protein [soil metagenome]
MTPPGGNDGPSRFEPPVSELEQPFWDATREQRLVLQWCAACDAAIHYPREACPRCLDTNLEWRTASGAGTVYAASIMPTPGNPSMAGREPYVVALIELAEGIRMMSNVVGCPPDAVTVGAAVRIAWEPLTDGRHLPVWQLA